MGYFDKFKRNGIPFMDTCTNGLIGELENMDFHITEWGFFDGQHGDCVAFTVKEKPGKFFFGNAILAEMLKTVEADNMAAIVPDTACRTELKQSRRTGRNYRTFIFLED